MTDTQDERTWILTGSVMILAVVAVGVVIIYTRSVMIPFVIAIFIASLVSPVVDYQVLRLKLPRSVAVSVSLLIVLVVITVLCLFVVGAAQQVVATTGKYGDSLANLAQRLGTTLDEWGIHLDQEKIGQDIRAKIPAAATQIAGTTVNLLSNMFLVTIFVIFLLAGRNPHAIRSGIYAEIDQKIRGYIGSKVAISAVTGILVWITLSLFGLELASVFAMFTFLLNFIPSIGSVIATLLPIPIAVAQFTGQPWMVAGVIIIPGAIQIFIGNGIEPKLMGEGLQLHPVTVVLALSFWGVLWGPIGMVLAVPITAIIRIVLMRFETVRPIGRLLAGELPGKTSDDAA